MPIVLHLQLVDVLNGKATIFVTMKTTMQDVSGMVEIAVAIMSTHNTALLVNAWILIVEIFQTKQTKFTMI